MRRKSFPYATPPVYLSFSKKIQIDKWLVDNVEHDKVAYTSYNDHTIFYFSRDLDYMLFMMQCYE